MDEHRIESGKAFIKEAFTRWYRVPEYQRPYVWGVDQKGENRCRYTSAAGKTAIFLQ
jgi:hypothetical protein